MNRDKVRGLSALALAAFLSVLAIAWAWRQIPPVPAPPFAWPTPRVEEVSPLGVRRGFATELTLRGANLADNPRLLAPFQFAVGAARRGDLKDRSFQARITVDPATPIGIYSVRVLTDKGISAPFPLAVGQLPQVQEEELINNSAKDLDESKWNAQRIMIPTVVEGELLERGDRDYFRSRVDRGQRIFAQVQGVQIGSAVDAGFNLFSPGHDYFRSADPATGEPAEPPFFDTLPFDGDVLLMVRFPGALRTKCKDMRRFYRLTVGAVPAAAEVYPLGGRRGETIQVELRRGTLDGVMVVPVPLNPAPGESVVRIKAPTTLRGPDGTLLDVEGLPPLIVGDLPEVLEPTGADAPPPKVRPPVVLNGCIDQSARIDRFHPIDDQPDKPVDEDRFTLLVTPGQRIRALVEARALGSALLPTIKVSDARGNDLAIHPLFTPFEREDEPEKLQFLVPAGGELPEHVTYDPKVEFTVPAGQSELTLTIGGQRSSNRDDSGRAYRITVLPVTPSFSIALEAAQASIPQGGTATVGVTVIRDGYDGPIALRLDDPPSGLTFRPGAIAQGKSDGSITLVAASDASFGPSTLDVIGDGRWASGPITVRASKVIHFGKPATDSFNVVVDNADGKDVYLYIPPYLRTTFPTQHGLFVTLAKAAPQGRAK